MGYADIDAYHAAQTVEDRAICDCLRNEITRNLPDADSKIWHNHPVWFLTGNPIVGYGRLKDCIRLMFWSGQSFDAPGLTKTGTFKAAERRYTSADEIDPGDMSAWLSDARRIQWDYGNIVKRKGKLIRLT